MKIFKSDISFKAMTPRTFANLMQTGGDYPDSTGFEGGIMCLVENGYVSSVKHPNIWLPK